MRTGRARTAAAVDDVNFPGMAERGVALCLLRGVVAVRGLLIVLHVGEALRSCASVSTIQLSSSGSAKVVLLLLALLDS